MGATRPPHEQHADKRPRQATQMANLSCSHESALPVPCSVSSACSAAFDSHQIPSPSPQSRSI